MTTPDSEGSEARKAEQADRAGGPERANEADGADRADGAEKVVDPARAARTGRTTRAARTSWASRTSGGRRPLVTTLRAVSAVAVLALAGGAVAGAALLPRPTSLKAAPLAVDVPPTEVSLVCPAPALTGSAIGTDTELGGASDVTSALAAGVLTRADGLAAATLGPLTDAGGAGDPGAAGAAGAELAAGEAAAASTVSDPQAPHVLRAQPTGVAAFATAGLAQRSTTGDLRGLGALACPTGATTAWFAAGRTTVGSSTVLTLANPGSTAATVSVRVWGDTGEVPLERGEVVVAPGETVEQALEAIAPDVSRLAVLVSSRGGIIAASLRTADLDGLSAAGLDLVGATGGPSTDALVPGVVLGASTVDDEDPSLVRVLNPGTEPAEVELELVGAETVSYLGGQRTFIVDPGVVADVSLAGAPAGTYALRATSTTPIVVGASLVRVGGADPADPSVALVDRAWLSSVPLASSTAVAVPGLGALADRAVLVLAAPPEEAATVIVTSIGADGAVLGEAEVTVPTARSSAVDVVGLGTGTALVRLESEPGVSASLVLSYTDELGELITVVPAMEDPQVERTVHVAITTG